MGRGQGAGPAWPTAGGAGLADDVAEDLVPDNLAALLRACPVALRSPVHGQTYQPWRLPFKVTKEP